MIEVRRTRVHPPRPPSFPFDEYQNWRRSNLIPFAVEIGCGVGFHPIHWAKNHPAGQILAIERTGEKFAKFRRRLDHHPILRDGVFAAHADASWLLPYLNESIDECFWLYPNPEPKRRNHRIAFSKLTEIVIARMKLGGRLTVATNILSYAEELRRELPQRYRLNLQSDELWNLDRGARSHFEKKYLLRGEHCYNFEFTKL